MAVTVSSLNLPTLPVGGYTEFEFQVWWQEVVSRIESAINAININAGEVNGSTEAVAVLEADLTALRSLVRLIDGEAREQIAALEGRIGQFYAQQKKTALALENVELMTWQL